MNTVGVPGLILLILVIAAIVGGIWLILRLASKK